MNNPDPHLIDLATDFSERYKTLLPGNYFSDTMRCKIRYEEDFEDGYANQYALVRFNRATKAIVFSKQKLLSFPDLTKNMVFFLVLWGAMMGMHHGDSRYLETDAVAIENYKSTGRPLQDILNLYEMLSPGFYQDEEGKQRLRAIFGMA